MKFIFKQVDFFIIIVTTKQGFLWIYSLWCVWQTPFPLCSCPPPHRYCSDGSAFHLCLSLSSENTTSISVPARFQIFKVVSTNMMVVAPAQSCLSLACIAAAPSFTPDSIFFFFLSEPVVKRANLTCNFQRIQLPTSSLLCFSPAFW